MNLSKRYSFVYVIDNLPIQWRDLAKQFGQA